MCRLCAKNTHTYIDYAGAGKNAKAHFFPFSFFYLDGKVLWHMSGLH